MAEKPAVGDKAPAFVAAVTGGDCQAGDEVSLKDVEGQEVVLYFSEYMGTERTTFVIGKDGLIKAVFPKVKPDAHVDLLRGGAGLTKTEIQKILDEIEVRPSRALGQNFLCDSNTARAIVDHLDPSEEDLVIEIGPGTGALTQHLAERTGRLILIEKDRRLADRLRGVYEGGGVEVIEADAVGFNLRGHYPDQPVKVIGNLPYSAGSEIIRTFLTQPTPVSHAVFTLQQEVGERLCAEPKTKAYGVVSVKVQSEWVPRLVRTLPPDVFHPRPRVSSAVVEMTPRPSGTLPCFDRALFDRLVRMGFSQRRKQLKKRLPVEREQWPALCEEISAAETVRAEELGLEQWVALTNFLDDHPLKGAGGGAVGEEIFDVVDEHDEVIAQAPRHVVHAENRLHRAVHIFLFNQKGELFLQKRSMLKDTHAGEWDSSASGHLDSGEAYHDAAVRELEEELGIAGAPVELVTKIPASERTDWEFVGLYRSEMPGKARLRLCAEEIDYGEWFPLEVVDRWVEKRPQDFATGFRECWRVFRLDQ